MPEDPDNLVLRLLREMREEIKIGFEKVDSRLADMAVDIKELSLQTALLEVRMGKVVDRLDKVDGRLDRVEKHLGLVDA